MIHHPPSSSLDIPTSQHPSPAPQPWSAALSKHQQHQLNPLKHLSQLLSAHNEPAHAMDDSELAQIAQFRDYYVDSLVSVLGARCPAISEQQRCAIAKSFENHTLERSASADEYHNAFKKKLASYGADDKTHASPPYYTSSLSTSYDTASSIPPASTTTSVVGTSASAPGNPYSQSPSLDNALFGIFDITPTAQPQEQPFLWSDSSVYDSTVFEPRNDVNFPYQRHSSLDSSIELESEATRHEWSIPSELSSGASVTNGA